MTPNLRRRQAQGFDGVNELQFVRLLQSADAIEWAAQQMKKATQLWRSHAADDAAHRMRPTHRDNQRN